MYNIIVTARHRTYYYNITKQIICDEINYKLYFIVAPNNKIRVLRWSSSREKKNETPQFVLENETKKYLDRSVTERCQTLMAKMRKPSHAYNFITIFIGLYNIVSIVCMII